MAAQNSVRIRLRYPDLDTFIEKFAPNVTRGGVFLASRNIRPVDATLDFEIQLAGGEVVLAGSGRVSWVKEFNPAEPNRPYGMGVQFTTVDPATKPILARILRAKDAGGARRGTGPYEALGAHAGAVNGKPAAPPIDTSVDLAAEYGLSDATVRRMIDRSWRGGGREDDLEELLRPDPVESPTLAQALSDLPRLLDPQYSRRRNTGAFRPAEIVAVAVLAEPMVSEPELIVITEEAPRDARAADETTQQTTEADDPSSSDVDTRLAEGNDADASGASESTDMMGVRDTVDTMDSVLAEPAQPTENNGRHRKSGH